jgi:glycolate oxidase FAD binding subunit
MKLLIGSHGTLAIITSASFKLFPAPRQTRTFVAEFHTSGEALKFRDSVLRSPLSPMCLELVSPKALVGLRPDAESNAWLICVRASGSDAVLRRYRAELGAAVTQELDGETETRWWQGIANFPIGESGCHEMARKVPELEDSETLAISVPLQAVAPVIELLERSEVPGVSMVGRVGVGHLLASFWLEGVESFVPALQKAVERFIQQLPAGSSIMTSRHRWWKTPTDLDSMRAIKHALDPKDILNQGRFAF